MDKVEKEVLEDLLNGLEKKIEKIEYMMDFGAVGVLVNISIN